MPANLKLVQTRSENILQRVGRKTDAGHEHVAARRLLAQCKPVLSDRNMREIGDPLVDLGLILCYWSQPSDPGGTKASLTSEPGWFARDELIGRYAEQTGRDLSLINYYEVFALFKLAVVLQQIYVRFHRGQTQDERFRHFDQRVRNLIQQAAALI